MTKTSRKRSARGTSGAAHAALDVMLTDAAVGGRARFAGRAFPQSSLSTPDPLKREINARELLIWSSRFCPRCLGDDGVWRLGWQLGWSAVCVRHGELLHDRCPQCGAAAGIGDRVAWARDRQGHLSHPARCPHTHDRRLCRAELATASTIEVAEDIVSAQR